MTTSAPSIPLSSGAPTVKGAPTPAKTDATALESPFSAALETQLPGGPDAAPEAGQASAQAAEKKGKAGQDSPIEGKDLPPVSFTDTSAGVTSPAESVANLIVPANMNGSSVLISPSDPTPSSVDTVEPAALEADQPALTSQPNARGGGIQTANPIPVKNESSTDSADTVSADPLAAMVDKIVLAHEAVAEMTSAAPAAAQPPARESAPAAQAFTHAFTDLMPMTHEAAPRSSLPATPVTVPLNQAGWDQALGERVHWLVTQRLQAAEIHLNPPELGPVEVRLSLDQDQARIQFLSPHSPVRDALEAAVPRLREMLGQSGIQLVDVNVGQHSAERHLPSHPDFGAPHHASAALIPGAHGTVIAAATTVIPVLGLVDYYV